MLPCLPDTDKEILHVSLLKTVLPFLTNHYGPIKLWNFADFTFSREFHLAIPWMGLSEIFDKTIGGEYNSILLHLCKLWQHVFCFNSKSRC